jgi:hypothetical protein
MVRNFVRPVAPLRLVKQAHGLAKFVISGAFFFGSFLLGKQKNRAEQETRIKKL